MAKAPSFVASADTRLLRQALAAVQPGARISYADLGRVIGKTVSGATPSLNSARNGLVRDEQIVFSVVRGEGLKRLTDAEIVAASAGDLNSIKNKARRAARKITSVSDYGALSSNDQLRHTATLSILTAVAEMTSTRGQKQVQARAQGRASELPIAETLAALSQPA